MNPKCTVMKASENSYRTVEVLRAQERLQDDITPYLRKFPRVFVCLSEAGAHMSAGSYILFKNRLFMLIFNKEKISIRRYGYEL